MSVVTNCEQPQANDAFFSQQLHFVERCDDKNFDESHHESLSNHLIDFQQILWHYLIRILRTMRGTSSWTSLNTAK